MKLKVALLAKPWDPGAAQMAWRLYRSGANVVVLVENRCKKHFVLRKPARLFKFLSKTGGGRLLGFFSRSLQIRFQYYLRLYLKPHYSNPVYFSAEEFALTHRVSLFKVRRGRGSKILSELKPDAGISLGRRPSEKLLQTARLGFYGFHLGDLAKYPGADPVFWAMASGEKQIALSVYKIAAKKNADAALAEHFIRIYAFDTPETLQEKAFWFGTYLTVRTLEEIAAGVLPSLKTISASSAPLGWPSAKARKKLGARLKGQKLPASEGESGPRVLHIITRMVRGGAQKNTLASVLGLSQKGYSVTLVSGPSWGMEDEILHEALERNVELLLLPELVREINPMADLKALFKLRALIHRFPFAIVHTHTSKAGLLGRLAARWEKVPHIIHTPHGHIFHSYFSGWKEQIFLLCERFAVRWTNRLVALTSQCRDEHLALGVGKKEQWSVIPSGVNQRTIEDFSSGRNEILDSLKIPRDRKIVGYVGRLAPVKGCSYLIRALLPIYWAKIDFHCLIVGDGEQREELEGLVVAIGLKSRVTFAGYQKDISKFLSVFDVLAVPSLNEGMGRVIVEAGFLSKPVVAAIVGGIPDLIQNEKTGLLIPSRNPDLMAAAIKHLLENPSKAAEYGKALHRNVLEGFTESQMVEKIHQLYQELLTGPTAGRSESAGSPQEEPVLKDAH